MKNLIKRFTSRKFLLALAACLTFYANAQYTELAATVIAYLGSEGAADAVQRFASQKYVAPQATQNEYIKDFLKDDDDDVDKNSIVPGSN